jgi:hypothetical protein
MNLMRTMHEREAGTTKEVAKRKQKAKANTLAKCRVE